MSTLVKQISSVCRHLHENYVMHGDIYAHNILVSSEGHCLLTDFGAASVKSPAHFSIEQLKLLEKIEVRAFGCLVDDIMQRLNSQNSALIDHFNQLKQACLEEDIYKRPNFSEIYQYLIR